MPSPALGTSGLSFPQLEWLRLPYGRPSPSPLYSLMSTTPTLVLVTALFSLAIRHDAEEAQYVEFGEQFPAVVQVGGLASGTVIAPEWVLTVAHAPEMMARMRPDAPLTVTVGSTTIEVAEVHTPEQRADEPKFHDIALLRLASPVPSQIAPLPLMGETLSVNQPVAIAGWGILSVADEGIEPSPAAMAAPTRERRAGWNVIDRFDETTGLLHADLDRPGEGIEMEASPCIGDSGGPALVRGPEGTWQIAGVLAMIDDVDEDRVVCEYGDAFGMTSVGRYLDWIEATMASESARPGTEADGAGR